MKVIPEFITQKTAITLGFWAAIFASVFTLLFVLMALPDLWLKPYWLIHFAFPAFAESLVVPRY
jgi:hypothetical protein